MNKNSIIFGIALFLLTSLLSWHISGWFWETKSGTLGFVISIYLGVLLSMTLEAIKVMKRIEENIRNKIESFEERIGRIIEYFALSTSENGNKGKLESALEKIRNETGKVKWIIAKFLSKKMCKHFREPEGGYADIYIDGVNTDNFIRFIEEIITECEKKIYWTCPYTPEEWFKKILRYETESDDAIKRENTLYDKFLKNERIDINDRDAVKLFRLFLESKSLESKIRLVNLDDKKWSELIMKANCFDEYRKKRYLLQKFIDLNSRGSCIDREFKKLNNDIQLYFVKLDDLKDLDLPKCCYSDFGIYDDSVVISYSENKLYLKMDNINIYKQLFDEILTPVAGKKHSALKSSTEIINLFEEVNSSFKNI